MTEADLEARWRAILAVRTHEIAYSCTFPNCCPELPGEWIHRAVLENA